MKKLVLLTLILSCLACSNDDTNTENLNVTINGVVQKGPFASGTNITIFELNDELTQTGSSFNATTVGNKGQFQVPNVVLRSDYVEITADGFFFNEITGLTTEDRIVLKAVSDVDGSSAVNVNLLTTLSGERIKYLVQTDGLSFEQARLQAQNEILDVFNFESVNNQNFEDYDFSEDGITSNQLLAISGLLLSIKNNQELTAFVAEFAFDIKEDGILDSNEIQRELSTAAETFPNGKVRVNLKKFYDDGTTFAGFQSYVEDFKNSTPHEPYIKLDHPASNNYGINLLSLLDMDQLDTNQTYCISQNLLEDNTGNPQFEEFVAFSITIAQTSGTGSYTVNYTDNDLFWLWNDDEEIYINDSVFTGNVFYPNYIEHLSLNKTPFTLSFEGEGEILVSVYVHGIDSSNADIIFSIDNYLSW